MSCIGECDRIGHICGGAFEVVKKKKANRAVKLKPCPFCGCRPRIIRTEKVWRVTCRAIKCVVGAGLHWFGSLDEARAAWNRRAGS